MCESVDTSKRKTTKLERALEDYHKLLDTKVNTEDFIRAIEQQSAIWDVSSEAYSNKQLKQSAWNEISRTFVPDFEQMSLAERNNIMTLIQKKWKSIRSCYTRELNRIKGVKSCSLANRKTQYTYFEQLRFLESTGKKSITNVDEEVIVNEEENETSVSFNSGPTCTISQKKSKKRTSNDHEKIEVVKKKIAPEEKSSIYDEVDEDKLFLLSMLSEFHKVPAENKLKLRAHIISIVAAAQTTPPQQWQQMVYPEAYSSAPPPSLLQYPQQPVEIRRARQQRMRQRTTSQTGLADQQSQTKFSSNNLQRRQDTSMPVQSPPCADTCLTSNESDQDSDSEMSKPVLLNV